MAEHDQKKNEQRNEIRRMKRLLEKMAEMAEHVEQTGSFESGIQNSVKRYNTIVEHLEDRGILAEDLFPELDEDSDSGQLGAEAKLLADYLSDVIEEETEENKGEEETNGVEARFGFRKKSDLKRPDLGMMVALAPFLERNELTSMVLKHFTGQGSVSEEATSEAKASAPQGPNLQTIISLAPHVDQTTLGQMVRACLASQSFDNPQQLVQLAPHMNSAEFSQILREYLPTWFGAQPNTPMSKTTSDGPVSTTNSEETSSPAVVSSANGEEVPPPPPPELLR